MHQWVGSKLSLFLTFVLFTGTSAVLIHEIEWLLEPSMRVPSFSALGPIAWATIANNAAANPEGHGPWIGTHRVLRNMHRHLNLPIKIGVPVVCSLAVLSLVTLVTLFLTYKKWWCGFNKLPRKRHART